MILRTRWPFVVTDGVLGIGGDTYRLDRGPDKEIAIRPASTQKGYTEEARQRAEETVNEYDLGFFASGSGTVAEQVAEESNRLSREKSYEERAREAARLL